MPAPATTDEFLDLIQKSGVADSDRIKAYLTRLAEQAGVPTEPAQLAGVLVRDGLLTYFQADQLLQGKWKRFSIGKYRVLEKIGVGGMGHVFLCEHKLMRRRVALKVLPTAKAQDPASLDRFYREARAVAALDHPNIVRAYDIDQDETIHFLVMEYVDGSNLQELVKKNGPLDPVRAAHYAYGAAVGLHHAHEMGLVHRDIKPGNILVDRAGVVKILDMGLARFFHDEDDMLTKKYDENILGTADYLAPEQAIDSHGVDIRADLYSLGATFYFMLTGQPPFPDGSVAQKLLWHQTREPAALAVLRPGVPGGLAAIVGKMMAKNPADRYQTPAEVVAVLAPWVQSPIAPPTDQELPQLSPAVSGNGSGQIPVRALSGPPTLSNGPGSTNAGSSGTPRRPPTPAPAARPARPAVTPPTAILPTAPPQPAPIPAPPAAIWSELAETPPETQSATDRPRRKPAEPEARKGTNRIVLLAVAGGVLLLALLGGVTIAGYYLFLKKPDPVAGKGTWYVSARGDGPDPARTLTTLRGALEQAKANERVVILDDRLEEPPFQLSDRGAGKKKGVTVEPGNASKVVVWAPKAPTRVVAAMTLVSVEDFHVSGLEIELGGMVDSGVMVANSCPGLTIENVVVRQPRVAGFRLEHASGEPGRPVRLARCRAILGDPKMDAGVLLVGVNRHLQVTDCRLEGPGSAGVKVDGMAADVELRNNRVYNFESGLRLTGRLSSDAAFSLTVTNNTFHTLTIAGVSTDHALAGPKQSLTLTKNYFAQTKEIAASPVDKVLGLKASDNARDAVTKEGKVNTRTLTASATPVSVDPANDAEFLHAPGGYGAQRE